MAGDVHLIKSVCQQCGREFLVKNYKIKNGEGNYCSRKCLGESQKKQIRLTCKKCGKEFFTIPSRIKNSRKYCSHECAIGIKPKKAREEYTCLTCGKVFSALPSSRKTKNIYCSKECQIKSFVGKSPVNKGKPGKTNPNKGNWILASLKCKTCGKIVTGRAWKIARKSGYCSKRCYWKDHRTNDKNIRHFHRVDYQEWRIKVLCRDGGKCVLCTEEGKSNYRCIQIHHIIPYSVRPELEFNVDNGIALCKRHHNLMRNQEDQWAERLAKLIGAPLLAKPIPNSQAIKRRVKNG